MATDPRESKRSLEEPRSQAELGTEGIGRIFRTEGVKNRSSASSLLETANAVSPFGQDWVHRQIVVRAASTNLFTGPRSVP